MIIGVAPSNAQLSFDPMLIFSGRTIKDDVMGGRSLTSHYLFQKSGYLAFSLARNGGVKR